MSKKERRGKLRLPSVLTQSQLLFNRKGKDFEDPFEDTARMPFFVGYFFLVFQIVLKSLVEATRHCRVVNSKV
jgi:hypothetical protein